MKEKKKRWVHDKAKVSVWTKGKLELWFTEMGTTKGELNSGERENKNSELDVLWLWWLRTIKVNISSRYIGDERSRQRKKMESFNIYMMFQFSSVAQSCPTLQHHGLQHPDLPVHHQFPESTQIHVYRVGDSIQLSYPPSSPSLPAFNLPKHQGLFKWVGSSHQVARVLEFYLQPQSFQWIFRADLL